MNAFTSAIIPIEKDCLEGGQTFPQFIKANYGSDSASKLFADADAAPEKTTANILTAMINITKVKYAKMRQLQLQYDYSTMRVRTFEEEADDNSLLVNHLIGQDPKGLAEFFFSKSIPTQTDRDACTKTLAEGKVPAYGLLGEPHHATCYRIFHSNLFNKLIFGIK